MLDGKEYKEYFDKDYFETPGFKAPYNKTNFSRDSYLHWAVVAWIVQSLKLNGDERILEIGCAFGWTVEQFIKQYSMDVYGQDISYYATHNTPPEIQNRIRECQDVEITFEGTFDLVYSTETFEHVPKSLISKYFNNIFDCLTEGGILFSTICLGWNDDRGNDIDRSHQTLQPRNWWNKKFKEAGFVLRKDLEAQAYELGLQTKEMSEGEWLPRKYNWHVFVVQKQRIQKTYSSPQILIRDAEPNLIITGNRKTSFEYPTAPFFQIDNWGNYLTDAFNGKYIYYKDITSQNLKNADLIMSALCIEVINYFNSLRNYSGKILGFIDGTPFMIESPDIRPKMIECLEKIDIVGSIHIQGKELYGLFTDKEKIVNCGHMFPIESFDDIYEPIERDKTFTILTGGYFASRTGLASVSTYLASTEADRVISPILPQGKDELRKTREVIPSNVELLETIPQKDFWHNILPQVDLLLHLGNHPATGRITAECAAAEIPSIGIATQYQLACFPELLVDNLYDIEHARHLIRKLRDDKYFYEELAKKGRSRLISSNNSELKNMQMILRRLGFDAYLET